MPITNCRRCGRIYNRAGRDLCSECLQEEDEAYKVVRGYLRQHRDVLLPELSEGTGVPEDWIVEMIRDGRLILSEQPNLYVSCERCGGPTQAGRYCRTCAKEMSNGFAAASHDLKEKSEPSQPTRLGYYSKDK